MSHGENSTCLVQVIRGSYVLIILPRFFFFLFDFMRMPQSTAIANYSACVVYTKTIIQLIVDESDGYLPPLWSIIVNSSYESICVGTRMRPITPVAYGQK